MCAQKTALISGITGQDGRLLSEFLIKKNYKVIGLTRREPSSIELKDIELLQTDYSKTSLEKILEITKPSEFYNLTGQTFVGKSWAIIDETIQASALIPIHLLEAIYNVSPETKLFHASSSEIYAPSNGALHENSPQGPINPYGCSKCFSHNMVSSFRKNYNLYTVNGVLFNHESHYRHEDFLSQKVVKGALKIKEGSLDALHLGNLDVERDWGYAGDYVEAMHLSLQQEEGGDYNICSGEKFSVRELVDVVFRYLELDYRDYIKVNQNFVRNNEQKMVLGDNSKISKLGWKPSTSFQDMLIQMIEYQK